MTTPEVVTPTSTRAGGLFGWWPQAPPARGARSWRPAMGWMLDAFDVMLYSMVLSSLVPALA